MTLQKQVLNLGEYKPILRSPGNGAWKYEKKLPLETDGQLRVIALGTGAAFSDKMFQSNFIIAKGKDVLFVDLGSKTTLKLAEFGLSVNDIKHIMITHSHADHIGSLEELILKARYLLPFFKTEKIDGEPFGEYMARVLVTRNSGICRPKLHIPYHYSQNLWDWSLRGGVAFSEEVELNGPKGEMILPHFFDLKVPTKLDGFGVDSWEFNVGNIHIQTFLTKHIPDTADRVTESMYSVGFVVDGKIYISGDSRFCQETTMKFGQNCELLLHDAQDFPGGVHAFYGDLKRLPPEIKQKMLLYHLSDNMLGIDVEADGFAGFLEAAPTVYDFD